MKLSKSVLIILAFGVAIISLQYQFIKSSREEVVTGELLIDATQSLTALSIAPTEINTLDSDGVRSANRIDALQDEERFTEIGNGEYKLNILSGVTANSEWKTIEQLNSTIEGLDEELRFTIEKQTEEFEIVDISDYRYFLDSLDLDVATHENILTQLVDSNGVGFTKMLHHAVELQLNGYVAWLSDPASVDEYFNVIAESSPAAVMGRNLDPEQLDVFYDFEARRLSQKADSPDYIAELVEKLRL